MKKIGLMKKIGTMRKIGTRMSVMAVQMIVSGL